MWGIDFAHGCDINKEKYHANKCLQYILMFVCFVIKIVPYVLYQQNIYMQLVRNTFMASTNTELSTPQSFGFTTKKAHIIKTNNEINWKATFKTEPLQAQ